jgi:hypothetical protein
LAPHILVFEASPETNPETDSMDEYPGFVVVGKAPGFMAMRLVLEVVAMGYTSTAPGLAQVAGFADRLSWYLHQGRLYLQSIPG